MFEPGSKVRCAACGSVFEFSGPTQQCPQCDASAVRFEPATETDESIEIEKPPVVTPQPVEDTINAIEEPPKSDEQPAEPPKPAEPAPPQPVKIKERPKEREKQLPPVMPVEEISKRFQLYLIAFTVTFVAWVVYIPCWVSTSPLIISMLSLPPANPVLQTVGQVANFVWLIGWLALIPTSFRLASSLGLNALFHLAFNILLFPVLAAVSLLMMLSTFGKIKSQQPTV